MIDTHVSSTPSLILDVTETEMTEIFNIPSLLSIHFILILCLFTCVFLQIHLPARLSSRATFPLDHLPKSKRNNKSLKLINLESYTSTLFFPPNLHFVHIISSINSIYTTAIMLMPFLTNTDNTTMEAITLILSILQVHK